ncbi:MAG: hypothetical protein ACK4RK_08020 [Gemmataceae bacterium]
MTCERPPLAARRLPLLIGAAALFTAWMIYLTSLAVATRQPIVLSRPQFLVSSLCVIADVPADAAGKPAAEVTVREVFWPQALRGPLPEQPIIVTNLPLASPPANGASPVLPGWQGPGLYILPLTRRADDTYIVTPLPPSPGYQPRDASQDPPRIYPLTPHTRQQLEALAQGRTASGR